MPSTPSNLPCTFPCAAWPCLCCMSLLQVPCCMSLCLPHKQQHLWHWSWYLNLRQNSLPPHIKWGRGGWGIKLMLDVSEYGMHVLEGKLKFRSAQSYSSAVFVSGVSADSISAYYIFRISWLHYAQSCNTIPVVLDCTICSFLLMLDSAAKMHLMILPFACLFSASPVGSILDAWRQSELSHSLPLKVAKLKAA